MKRCFKLWILKKERERKSIERFFKDNQNIGNWNFARLLGNDDPIASSIDVLPYSKLRAYFREYVMRVRRNEN